MFSLFSRMTRPSSESGIFYFGDKIGMATCLDVQRGIDQSIFTRDECNDITRVTKTIADRCACRDKSGEFCNSQEQVTSRSCDVCGSVGPNLVIGDKQKEITSPGNPWSGTLCQELYDLQTEFDFSNSQCSSAQAMAKQFCQCRTPTSNALPNTCTPSEDESYPCDPTEKSNCCSGSCKFRTNLQEYVCTSQQGQTPPTSYKPWWKSKPNPRPKPNLRPNPKPISKPKPGATCRKRGRSCVRNSQCCSKKCIKGSNGKRQCKAKSKPKPIRNCRKQRKTCTRDSQCCSKNCAKAKNGRKLCLAANKKPRSLLTSTNEADPQPQLRHRRLVLGRKPLKKLNSHLD
jgi:hypothetical protein